MCIISFFQTLSIELVFCALAATIAQYFRTKIARCGRVVFVHHKKETGKDTGKLDIFHKLSRDQCNMTLTF